MNRKGPSEEGWATWLLTQGLVGYTSWVPPMYHVPLSVGILEAQPDPLPDSWQDYVPHPFAGISILISAVGGTQICLEISLLQGSVNTTVHTNTITAIQITGVVRLLLQEERIWSKSTKGDSGYRCIC